MPDPIVTSPILCDGPFRTRFGVIPSSPTGVMSSYVRTGGAAEPVVYRTREAWGVDFVRLREVQRRLGRKRHGRPNLERAVWLCAHTQRLLTSTPPKAITDKTRWMQALQYEELIRLRAALVHWIVANGSPTLHRFWLPVDHPAIMQLTPADRMAMATSEKAALMLRMTCGTTSMLLPYIAIRRQDIQSVSAPHDVMAAHPVPGNRVKRDARDTCSQMWAFIEDVELPELTWIGPDSAFFAESTDLIRITKGRHPMPAWIREKFETPRRERDVEIMDERIALEEAPVPLFDDTMDDFSPPAPPEALFDESIDIPPAQD